MKTTLVINLREAVFSESMRNTVASCFWNDLHFQFLIYGAIHIQSKTSFASIGFSLRKKSIQLFIKECLFIKQLTDDIYITQERSSQSRLLC
jgi:hypothetical protein